MAGRMTMSWFSAKGNFSPLWPTQWFITIHSDVLASTIQLLGDESSRLTLLFSSRKAKNLSAN